MISRRAPVSILLLVMAVSLIGCAARFRAKSSSSTATAEILPIACIDEIRFTKACKPTANSNEFLCGEPIVSSHCVAPNGAQITPAPDHKITLTYSPGSESKNERKHKRK